MMATGVGARGRSRGLRAFAIAFALLQIILQGLFAVSDGYAETASSHIAPVHTEVPGNTHHRLHDGDCVVCHVLASGAEIPPRAQPSWLRAERVVVNPAGALEASPRSSAAGARLARAPPLSV